MTETPQAITEEEILDFVSRFLASNGLQGVDVTPDSELADLGLDSITTVGMLIAARDELVASGRLDASAKPPGMAPVVKVQDLVDLLRAMPAAA